MRPFAMQSRMLTMRGVFYPTGYMFLMYPTLEDAQQAAHTLSASGFDADAVSLLTPAEIHEKIAVTALHTDYPLPSAGTEAATVRHYDELAAAGHHALLVHAPSARDTEHVMEVLRHGPISYAQKYRHFVIEDLA